MDNRTAIETYNVLGQLDGERGFPIKFEYGLAKILARFEPIIVALQKTQAKKIDGQEAYEAAKTTILEEVSEKDDNGKPITTRVGQGMEYSIKDWDVLNKRMAGLAEEHAEVIAALKVRAEDFEALLDEDCKELDPYKIQIKHLPITKGNLKI